MAGAELPRSLAMSLYTVVLEDNVFMKQVDGMLKHLLMMLEVCSPACSA